MTSTIYICDFCELEYKTEEEAQECEDQHREEVEAEEEEETKDEE
jgi:hypothetical protein